MEHEHSDVIYQVRCVQLVDGELTMLVVPVCGECLHGVLRGCVVIPDNVAEMMVIPGDWVAAAMDDPSVVVHGKADD